MLINSIEAKTYSYVHYIDKDKLKKKWINNILLNIFFINTLKIKNILILLFFKN